MLSTSPDHIAALAPTLRTITREAGAMAQRYFRHGAETLARRWYKDRGSPVTEADLAVDAFLKEQLMAVLPEAGWLSEETADHPARLDKRLVWIVDPIDGTRAFMTGHPDWSISIALLADGRPLIGIVHAPVRDHLYEAIHGRGAARNGVALQVSTADRVAEARISGPKPLIDGLERGAGQSVERLPKVPSLALRLARVAEGSIDVGLVSGNSRDWDLAGADLILHEAGGLLTDRTGATVLYNQPAALHGELIAAGKLLHPRVIEAMR